MPPHYVDYFQELEDKLNQLYQVATEARAKGLDPATVVEVAITSDIAERIEKLIGPQGITERMRELESLDRREMSFKIAREIVLGRFGVMEREKAADQAVRTALAILTEGVTIAPIEGIPEIKIKSNPDGSQYLALYFAGPIRPAGGTAQALTLVVADVVRKALNLDRWKPSKEAVNRFIEEVRLYEQRVRRFQYHVSDEDLEFALENLPVEPTGVSTDPFEVSNYRDVPGIETNRLRGGALIVVVDGVVGRSRKLCGICEKVGVEGWEWLNRLDHSSGGEDDNHSSHAQFMDEIIVGRPVFSFPGAEGGFRLRYGRARNTGLAACGIHPATMVVLNQFMNTGLQLRVELPGKSAAVCPVDSLEPPVVRLKDGSVVRVETTEQAWDLADQVDKILFNGDILFNAGDFIQFNHPLLPSGYDEHQWVLDLGERLETLGLKTVVELTGITRERLLELAEDPTKAPTPLEALNLTKSDTPLHPRYTYHWHVLEPQALWELREALAEQWADWENGVKLTPNQKHALEEILVPHQVKEGKVYFKEAAPILERCLALRQAYTKPFEGNTLEIVNQLAGFTIRRKAVTYVGARMGRPEKAKERRMSPYVHCLYPVGEGGGPQRDITKPKRRERVSVEMANYYCPRCGKRLHSIFCPECQVRAEVQRVCPRCGARTLEDSCPSCNTSTKPYSSVELDLREELEKARSYVGGQIPKRIKCVKRLMNAERAPEHLGKGILRAKYDLSVFKDGTLRFDLTDIPLTHFTPREVGTPVERLRELGYRFDVEGKPLESEDQMLELMVQDIVIPEFCGDYLVKVSKFLDDELQQFYKMEPVYSKTHRDELVGEIVLGLAPHTSAAIVGRIIGWTKVRNCYAHPYWHAAKRRNCDGDEDAIMLALDPLLNFSKHFLPEQSGGLMDAPLFVIPNLNPTEVDKESHNVDVMYRYPREFYEMSLKGAKPSEFSVIIDTLGDRLGEAAQYAGFGYTHPCSDINQGSHKGAYTTLTTMLEKLESQLDLTRKLNCVDGKVVSLKILNSHFMKDIVGNLRAFTRQTFRCSKCNKKYRRPPLVGVCTRCGGPLLQTVYKAGIEKYVDAARSLIEQYQLGQYYVDRVDLVEKEILSLFQGEEEEPQPQEQFHLTDFLKPRKE